MSTPQYLGAAIGMQKGVAADEAGIKIRSASSAYNDPKLYCQDRFGGRTGFAHAFDPDVKISISGEVSGDIMSGVVFGVAATVANKASDFGITLGGVYLDDATVSEERERYKEVTLNYTSIPGLA